MTVTRIASPSTPGRRERKKAATRRALSEAALRLFLEHGYDQVGIRDIAEAADVSTTTLFKHFPVKEALVFDEDDDREAALVGAVRDRPAGQSIPAALREAVLRISIDGPAADPEFARFLRLVEETPALRDYGHRMWLRHQSALAQAIADDIGAGHDDPGCAALARFVLETPSIARGHDDPRLAINRAFELLEKGWDSLGAEHGP